MSSIFLKIVNMSITASWLILAVVLVRLLLKKAPKWIPCLLWGLVAIRLICPFSFGSVFSLIPSSETIPTNIAVQQEPAINSGITVVNEFINPVIAESFTPAPTDSVNPLQIIIPAAAIIWISGIVAYILLCRDIEMACDEKVICDMNKDDIAAYSQALLDCSFPRRRITACPLAFGEVGVKERVKGVLNYKKPAFWIILIAVIVCIVLAVCLMTDPFSNKSLSDKLSVSMDMAVAEHNRSSESENRFIATDYDVLLVTESRDETTVYAWVLYEEYSFDGKDVKVETGSHIPSAITFDTSVNDSSTYDVIEYWEPRDGNYYADDIQAKFLWTIREKALDITKSKANSENCLQAAREYFGVRTMNGEPDLSFLNYENAMSLVADVIDVGAFYYPPEGDNENESVIRGYVDGNALARYLDLVSWKQADAPKEDLLAPGSIQFCIEDAYRITIYKDADVAIVKYGYDKNRADSDKEPQQLQKEYTLYDELIADLKTTNSQMIEYKELLRKIAFGK